ncbi:hypothetical protein MHU86_18141 [Fragilaria crotonensis]|nr:hypothetical protein MHU86_18141 [Fragilaria crotonensis]
MQHAISDDKDKTQMGSNAVLCWEIDFVQASSASSGLVAVAKIGTPPNNNIATQMPIWPAAALLSPFPPAEGTMTDSRATLGMPYVPGMAADGNRLLLPINMRFKPVDRGRPMDIVWTLLSYNIISCTSVQDSFHQLWKDVIDAMAPNV